MSDYLTTETVTYEYDTSGRISKQTTVTTEGPDDHVDTRAPVKNPLLRIVPMSSVPGDPFTKAKVNQWFGEHEERDMVVDIHDFRERRAKEAPSLFTWEPAKPQHGLMHDEYPE